MELRKQPETEMEYWMAIEGLGGFVWRMNHDLGDGRIDDPNGAIKKSAQETQTRLEGLAAELSKKFGIILPKDCPQKKFGEKLPPPPKGKRYYWKWYDQMKEEYYRVEYAKMICSACPLSEGVKRMTIFGGIVPCKPFPGAAYRLAAPHKCTMLGPKVSGGWDEKILRENIIKKGGEAAYVAFKIKEAGLKTLFDPKTGEIIIPD